MDTHIHTYIRIRGSARDVLTLPVHDMHDVHAVARTCESAWRGRVDVHVLADDEWVRMRNACTRMGGNARKHHAYVERERARVRPARLADKRARAEIRERKRAERALVRAEREERERKRQAAIERVQARMRDAGV